MLARPLWDVLKPFESGQKSCQRSHVILLWCQSLAAQQDATVLHHLQKKEEKSTITRQTLQKNYHNALSLWAALIGIISSVNTVHTSKEQLNNKWVGRIENQRWADWKLKGCKMSECSNRRRGAASERAYYARLLITLPWLSQGSWLANRGPRDKTHS